MVNLDTIPHGKPITAFEKSSHDSGVSVAQALSFAVSRHDLHFLAIGIAEGLKSVNRTKQQAIVAIMAEAFIHYAQSVREQGLVDEKNQRAVDFIDNNKDALWDLAANTLNLSSAYNNSEHA